MSRTARTASILALAVALCPLAALAQYPSEEVGFNGPPINDPATSQEMFKLPEWSGTTTNYVVHNETGTYANNAAYRADGLQTEGDAAMDVFFKWVNPADVNAWVRLTTFNGPSLPNPALHTQGKVRFWITNQSEYFQGRIGICIGIRETGVVVPQMDNGGTAGDIEWVGVSTTPNGIVAGAAHIVNTTAAGDDVQVYPVGFDLNADPNNPLPTGTAVITPGPNGVMNTTPAGDDQLRRGYDIDTYGARRPIPAFYLDVLPFASQIEFNLLTGTVSVDGVPQGGGIAGFTGNGILDAPNNRGALEHIAFINDPTDGATLIEVAIDQLQFEAPVPDPVLPPTVKAPIIKDDTTVTVTDLMLSVNQIQLLRDHSVILTQNVASNDDYTFTLPQPAQTGQVYTAKQRDGITGLYSDESLPVTVLPAPSPYSFSVVIDEDGNNCSAGPWEFVPVTSVGSNASGPAPHGADLFNNDGLWQTIDVPLTDDALVLPWGGYGNGSLDDSTTGIYSIDSMWFTIADGATSAGPHEIFIDAVEVLDEFGGLIQTLHTMETGVNYLQYQRGQSSTAPTSSVLSTLASYDGVTSHRLVWTYPTTNANEALGMYHNIGYQCNTSPTFTHTAATIRFHMLSRGPRTAPDIALPTVTSPIIVGTQNTVRITNDASATAVQLYIDGLPVGAPVNPAGGTFVDFAGLSLAPGQSISATQSLPAGTSDLAYPRGVCAEPLPPKVQAPLLPGATTVVLTNVLTAPYATASSVTVYVNGAQAGTAAGGTATVNVTVAALQPFQVVTATQTVNGETSALSAPVTVLVPAPTIYKAPAQGDTSVRVMNIATNASQVSVVVNNTTTFTAPHAVGQKYVDVPVSGLVMGDTLVAKQLVGGVDSVPTVAETVTTAAVTTIFADNFEYSDAVYLTTWADSMAPRPGLSTAQNATPAGAKSVYVQPGTAGSTGSGRVQHALANLIPTATNPVVWNVNIYDDYGQGGAHVQFAQLNGQVADFYYQHVGMLSWSPQNTNYYQYRANSNGGPNWVDLTDFDAPLRSVGWHNFTVVHKGLLIDVYVDGLLSKKNITLTAETTYDMARIGPGYTSTAGAYYDDYRVETGPVRFGLVPPKVVAPLVEGDTTVDVFGVSADANRVTVFANGVEIGYVTLTPPNATDTATVPVTALVAGNQITLTQTSVVGQSAKSVPVEVGKGNGDLLVCIGIRETNDTGDLGTTGGTTGQIEWIGATGVSGTAPLGQALLVADSWQTFVFDPLVGPLYAFPGSGDGAITATRGVLEHLAVTVKSDSANRSSGPYALYVDNVVNVGAGPGGADFVITDFEAFTPGVEALFQEPTYSGTTVNNILTPPNTSEVSSAEAQAGANSALLEWFFRDTTATRWLRLTTSGAANVSRPIIDLTKPIRVHLLLSTGTAPQSCPGDLNCDGQVSFGDINPFVLYLSNYAVWQTTYAGCNPENGDINGDGNYPAFSDINAFVTLLSTSSLPIICP